MKKYRFYFAILAALLCGQSYADQVTISPVSGWVNEKELNHHPQIPHNEIKQGVYYLLSDVQIRIDPAGEKESFHHMAMLIVNQNGIEESSQININFDPSYQKAVLNKVLVLRNGISIDKTATAKISTLQREKELENLIYNGENTINIILDDIRIGDVIEYSYSIFGVNPVFNNIAGFNRYLQYSVPVDLLYFRLLWEKPTALNYKIFNGDLKLNRDVASQGYEYWIEKKNQVGVEVSRGAPLWFDPYMRIQFSELGQWQDVVRWGLPLYENAISTNEGAKSIAKMIRKKNNNKEDQIVAALQYVQNKIRYLGIEIGKNSHQPSLADETLKRRYGDCKDKAVLLISLLRELNVEAYPAMVDTILRKELAHSLPSVASFNHIIVQVVYDNKIYWLDPTRQHQYGRLNEIYQPDYGYALVLNASTIDLTAMEPMYVKSQYVVNDTFDLTSNNRNEVIFASETEYYGLEAERIRYRLADQSLSQIQDSYSDYYKSYYPNITTMQPVVFSDKQGANKVDSYEQYSIDDLWEENNDDNRYDAYFYSNAVNSYLKKPKAISQAEPVAMSHPVNIKQAIEVRFNTGGWGFEDDSFVEDNEYFFFSTNINYDDSKKLLLLNYIYRSKAPFVPADKREEYVESLNKVDDYLDYSIYENYTTTLNASGAGDDDEEGQLDWFDIVVTVYVLSFLLVVFLWLYQTRNNLNIRGYSYYPVALPKLAAMWILTFGIYSIYWFYKNWSFVKNRDNSYIMPAARGIFNAFWYYPLYSELLADNESRSEKRHLPNKLIAAICAVLFFIVSILGGKSQFTILALLFTFCLIVPLANYINYINNDNAAYKNNSAWRFRHYLLSILVMPLLVLTLGSEIGLTPHEAVISGNRVLAYNIKYMQRNGVLDADDNLIYFYSDAFLDIRDDGNGLTDRHVFSYWRDGDDRFYYEKAAFDEIKDINVNWAKSWDENTTIDIVRNDDSKFILYVSNSERKDKVFVAALRERLRQSRE